MDEIDLIRHELIGLEVETINCSDKNKDKIKGIVVDETRNLLIIEQGGKSLKIAKDECSFRFKTGKGKIEVDGKLLKGRPEERLKNKLPKKWS